MVATFKVEQKDLIAAIMDVVVTSRNHKKYKLGLAIIGLVSLIIIGMVIKSTFFTIVASIAIFIFIYFGYNKDIMLLAKRTAKNKSNIPIEKINIQN